MTTLHNVSTFKPKPQINKDEELIKILKESIKHIEDNPNTVENLIIVEFENSEFKTRTFGTMNQFELVGILDFVKHGVLMESFEIE